MVKDIITVRYRGAVFSAAWRSSFQLCTVRYSEVRFGVLHVEEVVSRLKLSRLTQSYGVQTTWAQTQPVTLPVLAM